jgi:hypothetical protein
VKLLYHPQVSRFIADAYDKCFDEIGRIEEKVSGARSEGKRLNQILDEFVKSVVVLSRPPGKECNQKEKDNILNELDSTPIRTSGECYKAAKDGLLRRMLSCFPRDYDRRDKAMITRVLKKFVTFSLNLFTNGVTKEKHVECENELKEIGGYELLYYCFNTYSETYHRPLLAVIISRFHLYNPLPTKYLGVLVMLRELLKMKISGKVLESELETCELIKAVINISVNEENKEYFFTFNMLPVIYDVIYKNTGWTKTDALAVLNNICNIKSIDRKRDVVDGGLNTFLRTLDVSPSSLFGQLPTSNSVCTQIYCVNCLCNLMFLDGYWCTAVIDDLSKGGVFQKIINLISAHQLQLKRSEAGLCSLLLKQIFGLLLNISIDGVIRSKKGEASIRRSFLTDALEQFIIEIHRSNSSRGNGLVYFPPSSSSSASPSSSSSSSPFDRDEVDVMVLIPLILILFHKGEVCPHHLLTHLSTVHSLIAQPATTIDYPRWSKLAWDGMVNAESSLAENKNK